MILHPKEKPTTFDLHEKSIAKYAKALGHPARVAILKLLLKKQSCICGDIVDELPLAQSTVSQHLKVLKEAGLIQGNIEGATICYCIDVNEWKRAQSYFKELFKNHPFAAAKCC